MQIKANRFLSAVLGYVELVIAAVLLIAVLLAAVGLVMNMGIFRGDPFGYADFNVFLSDAFTLVIGIEFVRMLVKHTPGAVVEVLLFAIARQMVVEHAGTWQTLVGVIAIAGVFATRKYLFVGSFSPADLYIFNAAKPLAQVNAIAHTQLPDKNGLTVGAFMEERLGAQGRPFEEGAKVTCGNTRLRIATLHEGRIETVDVFTAKAE